MKPSDIIDLKLTWADPANIIHSITRDHAVYADAQAWVTTCGVVLEATPLREIELGKQPNCMGCIGGSGDLPRCGRCNDTGYMDNGWADFPCACEKGDTARFEVKEEIVDDDGAKYEHTTSVTGEYLKREMQKWRRK